jgi:alpha-glucosidase (family GH31 glycosyl hydrolase)
LRGTTRTLDLMNGAVQLEQGLVSRAGWAVVDDSQRPVFDADGWIAPHNDSIDLYFFGYGHDYKKCLRDFCRVAGQVPLIPRWLLGNWWSRYYAYTQSELIELMQEFRRREIPLSICIIDMDWHITQTGNTSSGWTGYTWNRKLFPDPAGLIDWLHAQGLRTALNLHPAEGVHPHEEQYVAMANAMGIDPASQQPVRFDIIDPKFVQAYFSILHHPYEKMGIDFWWLDWQQGTATKLAQVDPLWWLNHLHFHDAGRDGRKRPFIFSRWGVLGNHRYPIGFSGDASATWDSLAFQPYFTATAANVAYGWWSHDIGGHQFGNADPELYTRWVQFGVFSPILRLHSTNNPYEERRPWGYNEETLRIVRAALQLRHALIPYIYTMAWRNHTQDLPLVTPMYYDDPECDDAYLCRNQYRFGSELIAAPFTSPKEADTQLARQAMWFPPGQWFNFFDGEAMPGNQWRVVYGTLADIPIFAKAGAIVPLAPRTGWGGIDNPAKLEVHLFPGADNRFELYEDDGTTTAYTQGQYRLTPFALNYADHEWQLTIEPARGDPTIAPRERTYTLIFHSIAQPQTIALHINGASRDITAQYDETRETLTIENILLRTSDTLTLRLSSDASSLRAQRDRRWDKWRKLLHTMRMPTHLRYALEREYAKIVADGRYLQRYNELKDAQLAVLLSVLEKKI